MPASWSIKIDLAGASANVDATMKPVITGLKSTTGSFVPADLNTKITDFCRDGVIGNTEDHIKRCLTDSLGFAVGDISHNIDTYFQHRGKFIYPGHGDLVFKNPKFTTVGNIITEVHYKESVC